MKKLALLILSTTLLNAAAEVKEITTLKEFKELSAQDSKPQVLFFYAPWCGACNSMKEPYNQVAQELKDTATLVKINIDNKVLKPLTDNLNITAIPTIYIRKVGVQPKDELKKSIQAAMR